MVMATNKETSGKSNCFFTIEPPEGLLPGQFDGIITLIERRIEELSDLLVASTGLGLNVRSVSMLFRCTMVH